MGLLDKLRQAKKPATEVDHPGKEANLIQVFDNSGKPQYLTKNEWRTKVLPNMISARWDSPDELYQVIVGTLQDGLPAEVADAAEHLYGSALQRFPEVGTRNWWLARAARDARAPGWK